MSFLPENVNDYQMLPMCVFVLRPHPGHTGNYTPVPGRRVGRTQLEESRRLVERYLGAYADVWKSTRE